MYTDICASIMYLYLHTYLNSGHQCVFKIMQIGPRLHVKEFEKLCYSIDVKIDMRCKLKTTKLKTFQIKATGIIHCKVHGDCSKWPKTNMPSPETLTTNALVSG